MVVSCVRFKEEATLAPKRETQTTTKTMEEFQKEFRGKLYGAIAASLVAGLLAAVLGIWGYVKTLPGSVGLTPAGAVMAFDLKEGCPTGWSPYTKAWGRFLVGAMADKDRNQIPGGFIRDSRGVNLSPRAFGEPGGEEMHLLTEPEMPKHSHQQVWGQGNGTLGSAEGESVRRFPGRALDQNTLDKGGDTAHNNMPPYIALYFCKKE
jgi:hypothetical protein